ncbi:MAG: hypothetical protein HUU16_00695 [Candidatus Omnitrophica bacterium]|nr:hypothetical protein [Candidatus Omnitrophota bacterium]
MGENRRAFFHSRGGALICLLLSGSCFLDPRARANPEDLIRQSPEAAAAKSASCLLCHQGIDDPDMHESVSLNLGCTDCHGGNPQTRAFQAPPMGSPEHLAMKLAAHVRPSHPECWPTSANPERTYTLLNKESPEFIRFINPGDLRVAEISCGSCHARVVYNMQKSMMTTGALLWGSAAYNNGILPVKNYILGESYGPDGLARKVNTVPAPTPEELARGVLPSLLPLPRWEIVQPGDIFRAFERGGKANRLFVTDSVGLPNPFEEPGKPDNRLGDRGLGTQLNISVPVLNIHKTRLNDPFLSFMGTCDHPGDYRSSGCTACHSVYANDRSWLASGPWAPYGHQGLSYSNDPTIPKNERGHPIKHQFTKAIPSSQCLTCHHHQPNAFVNTYLGFQMWDYESDAKWMYPHTGHEPSEEERRLTALHNPEAAAVRGNWRSREFLERAADLNPNLEHTQFADYHGHGWIFRAAFKKDRKGNLLDRNGAVVPFDSPSKFENTLPLAGRDQMGTCPNPAVFEPKPGQAVHLKDIHAEKGMHCVDCHFEQDVHGDGKLYGEYANAIEIRCEDCHGDIDHRAALATSGPAAPEGGNDLRAGRTPWGEDRFVRRGEKVIQRSMLYPELEWEVTQVKDTVDPSSPHYNPKAAYAKTIQTDNHTWGDTGVEGLARLAHSSRKMECYTCHTSWMTSCFGCHLPSEANWKMPANHYEGGDSRNYTTYNPQVARDDVFMLGISGSVKGNKIAPVRSSSALLLSNMNQNREKLYIQQPPISAPGYSSQAFNTHFPHAVRKTETMDCDDCHLSENNDNNAWMAQLLTLGTNFVNFMGRFAWVGQGEGGVSAVAVTEWDEPQAVIGSYLHQQVYPNRFGEHLARGAILQEAYHHHSVGGSLFPWDKHDIRGLQLVGQYLFTASGHEGLRVFDVANIDNKGFSERFVSDPATPLGHDTHVDTECATAVALGTNMPLAFDREYRPENQEQWPIHPLYRHAYVTDLREGLVVVNIETLSNRDPLDNFLRRCATFNPGGLLTGATNIKIAGNHAYICSSAGLVVVSIDNPLSPTVTAVIGNDLVQRPKAVEIQFRYAFVVDETGLKIVDTTVPEQPRLAASLDVADAHDIYVARTYAYIAAGRQGLVIVDVERPEAPFIDQIFNAGGSMNDSRAVRVASTNASLFAYVADGRNGLKVLQLTSPETVPGYLGFSPRPNPRVIACYPTEHEAVALSKGLDRDRAVDESGNQVSVFGRLGGRPFNLGEMRRLYVHEDGQIYKVRKLDQAPPPIQGRGFPTSPTQSSDAHREVEATDVDR